jgi:acyl transferase domain-containing protein
LDAAAGVASLIKAVLSSSIASSPLVNSLAESPASIETSPFIAETTASPDDLDGALRRRGELVRHRRTNAHVVIEEARAADAPAKVAGPHLLLLSARRRPRSTNRRHSRRTSATDAAARGRRVHVFAVGGRFTHRRAVVVRDARTPSRCSPSRAARPWSRRRSRAGRVHGVPVQRPGQPARRNGRASSCTERVYRAAIDLAAELEPHLGLDIRTVMFVTRATIA